MSSLYEFHPRKYNEFEPFSAFGNYSGETN